MMNFENIKNYMDIDEDTILTMDPLGHSEFPKPKEFIELTEKLYEITDKILPESGRYSADFIMGNTIPMQDIEMRCGYYRCQIKVYPPDTIMRQFKELSDSEYEHNVIIGGEIKIKTAVNVDGKVRDIVAYSPLIINKQTMNIGIKGSVIEIPKIFEFAQTESVKMLAESLKGMREVGIATWIGIQIALLNPVIRERTKIESIPDSISKRNNHKKGPKKYIKRVTLGDISDMDFGPKRKNHITEPFWWVTGHWREYKSGKKVFIQGYWKGPFREFGGICEEPPRERELVVE